MTGVQTCALPISTNLLVDGVAQRQGIAPFGIFEITGIGLVGAVAGLALLLATGRFLLPDRPDNPLATENESDAYLSHLILEDDSELIGETISSIPLARRDGVRILGVQRGSTPERADFDHWELRAGDRKSVV